MVPPNILLSHSSVCAPSCQTLCNPMDCCPPVSPLSMELSSQEYWSGLPLPPPGDFPDPGTEAAFPVPLALAWRSFTPEPPGKPLCHPCCVEISLDWKMYIELTKEHMNGCWRTRMICVVMKSLKLNIQKTKIMASSPITSWQIDGETLETVRDFTFWGSKITADSDCSHEIKRCLFLGRKIMKT